jgi:DnaK suppressor protein
MLLARRHELEIAIRDSLSSVRAHRAAAEHNGVLDASEVSDIAVQEDIELELAQMKRETLNRIDAALDRLNQGRYGRCIECGDDIPAARLRALPFAVRCLDCEDAREADAARQRMLERGSRGGERGLGLD